MQEKALISAFFLIKNQVWTGYLDRFGQVGQVVGQVGIFYSLTPARDWAGWTGWTAFSIKAIYMCVHVMKPVQPVQPVQVVVVPRVVEK